MSRLDRALGRMHICPYCHTPVKELTLKSKRIHLFSCVNKIDMASVTPVSGCYRSNEKRVTLMLPGGLPESNRRKH